jgi:hypothetical protein
MLTQRGLFILVDKAGRDVAVAIFILHSRRANE